MSDSSPTPFSCEVIILTALPVECQAVLRSLQELQEVLHPSGTIYHQGCFAGRHRSWQVAVAEVGMGGVAAALEAEKAISFFQARIAFFIGIAGGLKDVRRGDVVVATKVYAYESGKTGQQFEPRPELGYSSHALEQRARDEARQEKWLTRLDSVRPDTSPRVFIGALAAGEKVLASTRSSLARLLKKTYGDALAIEMEGHGFLHAVHLNHTVHGLVIRGISDLIDDKPVADATGWQQVAAQHAAAFAFQILATFTLPSLDGPSSPVAPAAIWNVPYPRNPYFTGRDDLLDQLAQELSPEIQDDRTTIRRAALTQPRAIQGLGGIGKTQIAIEYAYRSRELNRYTHIIWINAASEETLPTSFAELAELIPAFPSKGETDQRKLVAAIKHWLEQCQEHWLLIFDNADEVALVREYLPQQGIGSILLTTRAHAVGSLATSVEVETMDFLEGTQLLLRRAQQFAHVSEEEINRAGNIVVALDHFPLALDQAGAYLEETGCSFETYLYLYQTSRQALLAQRGMPATDYPHSVATTWLLSFHKMQQANPAAAELLQLCSFLAPDSIPEELIKEGAAYWPSLLQKAAADSFAFQQMIADLLKFSLVKRLAEERILSIHRLVQAVQRDQMDGETQHYWAERVVRAVNEVFPDHPDDMVHWPQCLRYLEQTQTCYLLIEHYGLTFVEAARVLSRAGLYLVGHALYSLAEPLHRRALAICEQQLGATHPDTAQSYDMLGHLYRLQGKYQEAEPLLRRGLTIREQALGPTHPDTARSLSNVGHLYVEQGKFGEAESLFQRALAIRKQALGLIHPDTAQSFHLLGRVYNEQGRYSKVEPLFQQSRTIHEQTLGPTHPDTLLDVLGLGWLYSKQGRYQEAESLFQQVVAIREQVLGPTHPDTAEGYDALGWLYWSQGKYKEAEPLYQQALVIREQALEPTHPDTAQNLLFLGLVYSKQRKYQEAELVCQRAIAIYEQVPELGSLDAGKSMGVYVLLLLKRGRIIKAVQVGIRGWKILGPRVVLRYAVEHATISLRRIPWKK